MLLSPDYLIILRLSGVFHLTAPVLSGKKTPDKRKKSASFIYRFTIYLKKYPFRDKIFIEKNKHPYLRCAFRHNI